jgi:protein-S-isoprenylcysteine O-methyltransferase Ste14
MASTVRLRTLIGSGDRIGLFALPVIVGGLALNVAVPDLFSVGGPSPTLRTVSIVVLVPGITIWIWSVVLILMEVPRGELITGGPYRLVKHPLYTGVSLLVLPWLGFLLNSWLGLLIGLVLYVGSRRYAPEEEAALSERFGAEWDAYQRSVVLPWL